MAPKKGRPTLDVILAHVVATRSPRSVRDLGVNLHLDEAEELCFDLLAHGMEVEPFDFPTTRGVWQEVSGVPYKMIATKQFIRKIAEEEGVDYRTFEGFKQMLPRFNQKTFWRTPINEWGTILQGMLAGHYRNSPSTPILELVSTDGDFTEIQEHNLRPYDFRQSPRSIWVDDTEEPTNMAREATKRLIQHLGKKHGHDYRTVDGFRALLPYLTKDTFAKEPINEWDTTLGGMLANAYINSPSTAVLDLVQHDDEFKAIRDNNLQPYDFPMSPLKTWVDDSGEPTDTARKVTKKLVQKLAEEHGEDHTTVEGFRALLPYLTGNAFNNEPINIWDTTLCGMYQVAYSGSPSAAVLDLVQHDDEFKAIKDNNLQPYDFPMSPLKTWVDDSGEPTDMARAATKRLIQHLGKKHGHDYKTVDGFRALLPYLTREEFINEETNVWNTTLGGVIDAYGSSPSAAVLDLVQHDDEFKAIRDNNLQPYDFHTSPRNTWIDSTGEPTDTARAATRLLVEHMAKKAGVDYRDRRGLEITLRTITANVFHHTPINIWNTRLQGMIACAYADSPGDALFDLINNDSDFLHGRGTITRDMIGGYTT